MLRNRILTALVLGSSLVWTLFFAAAIVAKLIVTSLVLAGAWEWSVLMKLSMLLKRIGYLVLLIALGIISQLTAPLAIIYLAVGGWLAIIFCLLQFSHGQDWLFTTVRAQSSLGIFILLPFWLSIIYLLQLEPHRFIISLLLITVIANDTAGYFIGRYYGKRKLAAAISPNKTVAGMVGGLVSAAILVASLSFIMGYRLEKIMLYVMISVITTAFAVLGDLVESAVKRQAKVKDSGNWLPGHGGILDRIDGYTAAAPCFTVLLCLLGG